MNDRLKERYLGGQILENESSEIVNIGFRSGIRIWYGLSAKKGILVGDIQIIIDVVLVQKIRIDDAKDVYLGIGRTSDIKGRASLDFRIRGKVIFLTLRTEGFRKILIISFIGGLLEGIGVFLLDVIIPDYINTGLRIQNYLETV